MKKIFRTIIKKKKKGMELHFMIMRNSMYQIHIKFKIREKKIKLKNLKVILPCKPSKIICAADNYYSKYSKNKKYKEPYLFKIS